MQKHVALLIMLSITPFVIATTYNPYHDTYPGWGSNEEYDSSKSDIGYVCDDADVMSNVPDDKKTEADCLCNTRTRALFEAGMPTETETYGDGSEQETDWKRSQGFYLGACSVPSCAQMVVDTNAESGLPESTGLCLCSAPILFGAASASANSPGFDVTQYTEEEDKNFRAFCAVQTCYDSMKALVGMATGEDSTFPDFCPYDDPKTFAPSSPVALNVEMTIAGDVSSVNEDDLKQNFANVYGVTSDDITLSISSGSVKVNAQVTFADENKAVVAISNVAAMDKNAMSASLGVTVTEYAAPSLADVKPAGGAGGSTLSAGVIAGIIIGAVALLAAVAYFALKTKGAKQGTTSSV